MFAAKGAETFSEADRDLIVFDLRIAAERYEDDRRLMLEGLADAKSRGIFDQARTFQQLAENFERQAARARRFAEQIEDGGGL